MKEFFNNSTVAAFFGAFAAFILVTLTDIRRRYRDRSLLRFLVLDNLEHARKKRSSIIMNRKLLTEDNKITDAPFMPFPTQSIRDYKLRALDVIGAKEKQALDALLYWMEAVDELIRSATNTASMIRGVIKAKVPDKERTVLVENYLELINDAEKNLGHLISMTEWYTQRNYQKIIEFQHPVSGSEGA